ncbi:MAG: hypothetical protein ACK4MF_01780 [Hyphomicrobiaceae bacterium]
MRAETVAAPGAPASMPASAATSAGHIDYHASGGRQFAFSLIFLLLLPFYASLGPMIFWRLSHGLWTGTVGLMVLAVAFTVVMYLVLVELLSSVRSHVHLGLRGARVVLPSGRGLTAQLAFDKADFAYEDVEAVEMRREVYGGALAPTLLKGARVVLKDGRIVRLGYINEVDEDPAFPVVEIAERIAHRAHVPLVDGGNVRRSARRKMLGIKSVEPRAMQEVTAAEVEKLNRQHARLITLLVIVLVVLVGLGMLGDMLEAV